MVENSLYKLTVLYILETPHCAQSVLGTGQEMASSGSSLADLGRMGALGFVKLRHS